jgi:two-component sensor histidine kinase
MDTISPSILIVDNERVLLERVEKTLANAGFALAGAVVSNAEAIERARALAPGLVLMDLPRDEQMDRQPQDEVDWAAVCEAIQHALDIPVVLISEKFDEALLSRTKQVAPYGFVLKPFQDEQLLASIDLALAAKARERAHRALEREEPNGPTPQVPEELQLKEIHHRIKNQLNMVNSFIDFQSRHLRDPEGLNVVREIKSRIAAISHIHQQIYNSKDLESVNAKEYFAMLEKSLRFSYLLPASIKLSLESGGFELDAQRMLLIGLIITEFVSNSLKHGFPGLSSGEIHITLQKTGSDYILMLSDSGVGLPRDFDFNKLKTFGLQILRGMVEQLKGNLQTIEGLGTTFLVAFEA